jgi:two-component system sensor histidine kinase YesM
MEKSKKFKEHMQKSVIKKIIALITVGVFLYIVGLLLVTLTSNEINASQNLQKIKVKFISLYQYNEDYLLSDTTMDLCRELLFNNSDTFKIENSLRHLNKGSDVKNKAILCDSDFNIVYTSYSENELTSYLYNYNSAICYKTSQSSEDKIYNAVFVELDKYSDYIFVKPVFDDGIIIGYFSLYLQGSDWNYQMSELNFDGIITDKRNNVIFFSRSSLITNNYIFEVDKSKIYYVGKERFWLGHETLQEYGVNIYSLVYYPSNVAFLIGIIVIIIMGFLWYKLANQMAAYMAEKNSTSITKLVSEIQIIRKDDQNYRVKMDTGDEFEDVAYQINYMLDNICILNKKNTELLKLNCKIEINQLTAQINPHFLYNTLEIIRNFVLLDAVFVKVVVAFFLIIFLSPQSIRIYSTVRLTTSLL